MAYSITADNYFQKSQPAKSEELINTVEVLSLPLEIQDFDDSVYKSNDPIEFNSLETKTIEIKFNSIPIKDPSATAYIGVLDDDEYILEEDGTTGEYTNATMTCRPTYFAWGAELVITNPIASTKYCIIVCTGYPIKCQGKRTLSAIDDEGVIENGVLTYKLKENHLIQKDSLAQIIADTLLDTYKIARKDISIDWRGDLALELQDEIEVPEYNKDGILTIGDFTIFKQQTIYDGTLKQKTEGRKIAETTTTTTLAP